MANNKKKVLFFTPGGAGGSQRMTITIAKLLPKESFEVKVVIVDRPGCKIEKFIPKEMPIVYMPIRNIWDFTMFRMASIMRKEKADIVFCSLRYMAVHMVMGAKMLCRNIQCIVRSDNDMKRGRWYNYALMKLTFPWCKWIIAQQDEMRQEIIEVLNLAPSKVIALQNPLDKNTINAKIANVESPYPNDDVINYSWVARFNTTKGQDILAEAFAIVHRQNPKTRLYMVGDYDKDSPIYQKVDKIIKENGLQNSVYTPGYDNNPYRWMKFCNVFVLPSRYEGLPNALIEALYLGAPSVASDCIPIINRIIKEGVNGYVVPVGDATAMAEAMIKATAMESPKFTYCPAETSDFVNLFV